MRTLLLGPTKWAQGFRPDRATLPQTTGDDPPDPIEVRRRLVRDLTAADSPILILEDCPSIDGEALTTKFHRLLREGGISLIEVYWPAGSNRSGLDVEIGFVLSLLDRRELLPVDVRLEIQSSCLEFRENEVVFLEAGKRTHYFLDLVQFGCAILTWDDFEDLTTNLRSGSL